MKGPAGGPRRAWREEGADRRRADEDDDAPFTGTDTPRAAAGFRHWLMSRAWARLVQSRDPAVWTWLSPVRRPLSYHEREILAGEVDDATVAETDAKSLGHRPGRV